MKLLGMKIPKTGFNKHKGYPYHELVDTIPVVTKECYENNLGLEFPYSDSVAILKIVDLDNPKEYVVYRLTMPQLVVEEKNPNNKLIQAVGANATYLQRYLLKLAFPCLSDKDVIDFDNGTNASSANQGKKSKSNKPKQVAEKVEDTPVNINVNELIIEAEKVLKKKGLSDAEITEKAIRMQVQNLRKWNLAEKKAILKFFNEKEGASK